MFKEFTRCSRVGFGLSVLSGGAIILLFAGLAVATGSVAYMKFGLVLGLACARLAEGIYSKNCPWSKAGLEGAVLALIGTVLVLADDLVISRLA